MARDNKSLGTFTLSGIDPAPKGVPQIEITFNIDANGIMNVTAKDKKNNKEASITIKGSSNLNEEEINRMVKEAEENKEKDNKIKEQSEIKYRAESLIAMFEKGLNDEKAKSLTEQQKAEVKKNIDELKDLLKNEKWDDLKKKIEIFEQAFNQFANAAANSQNNNTENKDEKKNDAK